MRVRLVRHRKPLVAPNVPGKYVTTPISLQEHLNYLHAKLLEESAEFLFSIQNQSCNLTDKCSVVEEGSDVIEVVKAVVRLHGITWDKLLDYVDEKYVKVGGFYVPVLYEEYEESVTYKGR